MRFLVLLGIAMTAALSCLFSLAHADTVVASAPTWLDTLISSAAALPTIGPLLVKVLGYGSLAITITTALCAFLVIALRALSGIAQFAKLGAVADKIQAFEDGKILYYLKYISAFNAQKPVVAAAAATVVAVAPATVPAAPVAQPTVTAPVADQPKA